MQAWLLLWISSVIRLLPPVAGAVLASCTAPWTLAGLGHCVADVFAEEPFEPLRQWFAASLRGCLQSCDDLGQRCAHASFKDDNILHREDERTGLCLLASHCPVLRATSVGTATFMRRGQLHQPESRGPRSPQRDLATLAPAEPNCSPHCASRQLCATARGLQFAKTCETVGAGLFRFKTVGWTEQSYKVAILSMAGKHLCGGGTVVRLAEGCNATWDVEFHYPPTTAAVPWPCVQLRHRGLFLAVEHHRHLVLRAGGFCWVPGFEQWRMKDIFLHSFPEVYDINVHQQEGDVSNLWLQASPSYSPMLNRFLERVQKAGDPIRACVLWIPDLKDINLPGFRMVRGTTKDHAFPALMLQIEAEVVATFRPRHHQAEIVIVSDLDVILFHGWLATMQKCVTGPGAADVCFTQRQGFDDTRIQLVNAGVSVSRVGDGANAARLLAEVARHQSQDVFESAANSEGKARSLLLEADQTVLNYVLWDVRQAVSEMRATKPVRWGVYNPLLATSAFFTQPTVLSTQLQHMTASSVSTRMKLSKMDATELLREDLASFCPPYVEHGTVSFVGPLDAFCHQLRAVDPHTGPLLPTFKVHEGYGAAELLIVIKYLANVTTYWHAMDLWIQAFGATGYRHYRQARRNSTDFACAQIWRQPCVRH